MVKNSEDDCRLRIDPVLVDKFRRLQGGINEVGTKIVRDFGLRYQYDKNRGTLELIGPDTEILGLAVETLRFWVEDDEFPDTGITCQVGYPNRNNVIWRFHGDYAKKFDHLFAEDIAKLKLVTSFNIKAVPTKRNPEYVELYCHFSVYHQVKSEVKRITKEISRIFQNDFFIPKSDFLKARDFARSKISDDKVLYALKEYPDNKVRVWLFARDQMDVIRAKKEWVLHVGIIARENEFTETVKSSNSIKSASFYGHPASEIASEMSGPTKRRDKSIEEAEQEPKPKQMVQTTLNLSSSRSKLKSQTRSSNISISSQGPRVDNSNFPRPPNFVYPINKEPLEGSNVSNADDIEERPSNPFVANAELLDGFNGDGILDSSNPALGEAKWVKEDETNLYPARNLARPVQNRIYVHHQVNDPQFQNPHPQSTNSENSTAPEQIGKLVVHPEMNLVENERYNPTHHSKSVLTSVTDPRQAPAIKRGNKGVRPGERATKKTTKVNATTRQKRPVLKAKKPPPTIRYNINVNGLDIYMYKHDISKLSNMDALVNVVAPSLKEGDHIARTLFAEAGKKIQDELDIHLRLHGEENMGENVVTSAGKLPALGMIHVVSPIWQKYTVWEDCASDLHKALYDTLKTAETHKYRRIGIPTIGSEPFFGIPKDLVAEVYVKALIDYSMGMGPMYPVLEIHLVDNDPNMLTYIKDAYESWASTPGVADMTHHIIKGK
ncbi:uncharacterized protein LOC128552934 [Mercenaria mercenaria]|uniref:uncharacterized protein LOC128552934 n=1 Tax=Mercenaria mercenaria TaxID=6596 RepID=UPI00234EEEAB|nr:uncharacterized protein LOC128552934 [Mercenaria mercenaria]